MIFATCKGYAINVIIKNRGAKPTKTRRKMNSEKKAIIGSFAASLILAAIAIVILCNYNSVLEDLVRFFAMCGLIASVGFSMMFAIAGLGLIIHGNGEDEE